MQIKLTDKQINELVDDVLNTMSIREYNWAETLKDIDQEFRDSLDATQFRLYAVGRVARMADEFL